MTYSKPDITVLGDAACLIQGGGTNTFESDKETPVGPAADGELDD